VVSDRPPPEHRATVLCLHVGAEFLRSFRYVERTRLLVDNSNGADAQFASDLRVALTAAGFEVGLREPSPLALYDTSVHFVVEGVAIRLEGDPRQFDLAAIAKAVRETEARRPSEHRRFRDVPIYAGESSRVLTWVDVFD
jgi:hypothetical protein